jgi:hypothetical protein
MAIDKKFWKELAFYEGGFPDLICPTCDKGLLKQVKDSFKFEYIKHIKEPEDWLDTQLKRFIMMLKCNNKICQDFTVCIGKGSIDTYYEETEGNYFQVPYDYFKPFVFIPSLKIIPIISEYPESIKEALESSFAHFFSDSEACGNKIRTCVEILMDDYKIAKTTVNTKRKRVSLNLRFYWEFCG